MRLFVEEWCEDYIVDFFAGIIYCSGDGVRYERLINVKVLIDVSKKLSLS